jgi:hypothetical protein
MRVTYNFFLFSFCLFSYGVLSVYGSEKCVKYELENECTVVIGDELVSQWWDDSMNQVSNVSYKMIHKSLTTSM